MADTSEYFGSKYFSYHIRLDDAVFGRAHTEEIGLITEFAGTELEKCTLHRNCDEDEVIDLLWMVQYAENLKYQPAVEHYLNGPNPAVACVALQVLCFFYDVTGQYIRRVLEFMRGVSWDPFEDLQSLAWAISAYYLEENVAPELLQEVISIAEDETQSEEQRHRAYGCLAFAMGVERDKNSTVLYSNSYPTILEAAKERLRQEQT